MRTTLSHPLRAKPEPPCPSPTSRHPHQSASLRAEAGSDIKRHFVKVNVLLTRAADVASDEQLYTRKPSARRLIRRAPHCVIQALPDPAMLIEIEAVASLAAAQVMT